MSIETVQDSYKLKFHNLFVSHFLPLSGGYDLQKDYECMYRLIRGGSKITLTELKFILLTQKEYINILKQLLLSYQIFTIEQIDVNDGIGVIISFDIKNEISKLKSRHSSNLQQKQIKQLIINCYRALKKSIGE